MKPEDLIDAIGMIDDKIIIDSMKPIKKKHYNAYICAIGVGAAAFIGLVILLTIKSNISKDYGRENSFIYSINNSIFMIQDNQMSNLSNNIIDVTTIPDGKIDSYGLDVLYYRSENDIKIYNFNDGTTKVLHNEDITSREGKIEIRAVTDDYFVYTLKESDKKQFFAYSIENEKSVILDQMINNNYQEYIIKPLADNVIIYYSDSISEQSNINSEYECHLLNLETNKEICLGNLIPYGCYSNGAYYSPNGINTIVKTIIPDEITIITNEYNTDKPVKVKSEKYIIPELGGNTVCLMCRYSDTELLLLTYDGARTFNSKSIESVQSKKRIYLYNLVTGKTKLQFEYTEGGFDDMKCNSRYGVCSYNRKEFSEPGYIRFEINP